MSERLKTSLMISKRLTQEVDDLRKVLGISKSDFVAVALAFFLIPLATLKRTPMKRKRLLDEVEKHFQKVMADARARL